MQQTEDAFRRTVLKKLRALPDSEWFIYPRTRFAPSGISDIIGCLRGRFVAIELKRPSGKHNAYGVTPLQDAFLARVRGAGGTSFTANDWEQIARELRNI